MIEIPLYPLPAQKFSCVLDGQDCMMTVYQRGKYLYLDLSVNGNPVCAGAICQNGAGVVQSPSILFSGTLHFWDHLGKDRPCYTGLGERWKLYFVPASSVLPSEFV